MVKAHSYICRAVFALCLAGACHSSAQEPKTNSASASSDASGPIAEEVAEMVQKSYQQFKSGDLDEALREIDVALQLDSHNASAYEVRGAIYIQKKLWDRAEQDYTMALALDPAGSGYKYNLAEIKFMQKAYDDARPRFALLLGDETFGDLAAYKIFLCDLLTGYEGRAAADLDIINKTEAKPSYYYANAAWDLAHHKSKDANALIISAQQIFDSSKNASYLFSLEEVTDIHASILTFVTKNGETYDRVKGFIEDAGLRVSSPKGWKTIPFDQLPDDLSSFPDDLQKQIAAKRKLMAEATIQVQLLSFTTRQGKVYDQVRVSLDNDGLRVLSSDGWITVPFQQLPDDLSPFPDDLRKQIEAKHAATPDAVDATKRLSFITKQGRAYDQVRVSLVDDGLRVLTSDGWITVPFQQLPDDLSSFPDDLRKQIEAKQKDRVNAALKTNSEQPELNSQ